ncbi:MAG: hypothetical protein K0T99_03130 [Alphaproteobacteria bacterium]|nr:hypothetical protein [Alphaproteobacteria bacterium]
MKNKEINNICERLLEIEDFFKLYYSYEEDNEFKIWLEYHDQDNQVNLFYDNLHLVVNNEFSPALTDLFKNNPDKIKKLLSNSQDLRQFLSDNIFVLEIFNKEWNKYLKQEGESIQIVLTPDNDENRSENNDESSNVIKFEQYKDSSNKNNKKN